MNLQEFKDLLELDKAGLSPMIAFAEVPEKDPLLIAICGVIDVNGFANFSRQIISEHDVTSYYIGIDFAPNECILTEYVGVVYFDQHRAWNGVLLPYENQVFQEEIKGSPILQQLIADFNRVCPL